MYPQTLLLHSWLRWAILAVGIVAVIRAFGASRSGRAWSRGDDRLSQVFVGLLDLQVLIGLILYFALSPITQAALSDFGGAMKVSAMRYWAVEHAFGMFIALALAHAGRARARRATAAPLKHRRTAVFFLLALVAIIASTPWPGTPYARPLFRW